MLKIDFHVHSKASSDCFMKLEKIIDTAKKNGLNGIAIVDHHKLGNYKQRFGDDFILIRGEEILTRSGEVIALNINERIKSFQRIEDTIEQITDQGGTIILPHPFCFWRKGMTFAFNKIKVPYIMEVMNSMAYFDFENNFAEYIARKNNLPVCGGSDAHRYKDIGRAYTELSESDSIDDILTKLVEGKGIPHGKRGSKLIHLKVFTNVFFKPAFNRWIEE